MPRSCALDISTWFFVDPNQAEPRPDASTRESSVRVRLSEYYRAIRVCGRDRLETDWLLRNTGLDFTPPSRCDREKMG
jgi:hypothetical protein